MDKKEALKFLRNNQPMPDDEHWTEELAIQYDDVRKFFLSNPDPECIPLFLHSFGNISGFGLYQTIEDVIKQFDHKEVLPHLLESLKSERESIRYWTAQICMQFPDKDLIEGMKQVIVRSSADTRFFCYSVLELVMEKTAKGDIDDNLEEYLKERIAQENDEENRELLKEIITTDANRVDG